jgi:hypothetical protein
METPFVRIVTLLGELSMLGLLWVLTAVEPAAAAQPPARIRVDREIELGGRLLGRPLLGPTTSSRVTLVEAGKFETTELRGGSWRVTWVPDTGGRAPPREVLIDDQDEQFVSLRYEGGSIEGIVLDANNLPVPRASVTVDGMEGALSGADGTFTIVGMIPGEHRLRARERHRASDAVVVRVVEGTRGEPVRLVLDRDARRSLVVTVVRATMPAVGAIAVLDIGPAMAFGTVDVKGVARFEVPLDVAAQARAAALHQGEWVFGNYASGDSLELSMGETGGLIVEAASENEELRIVNSTGWDVSGLLQRFGGAPRAGRGRPFFVHGLPTGVYSIRAGSSTQTARVERDQNAKVVFR